MLISSLIPYISKPLSSISSDKQHRYNTQLFTEHGTCNRITLQTFLFLNSRLRNASHRFSSANRRPPCSANEFSILFLVYSRLSLKFGVKPRPNISAAVKNHTQLKTSGRFSSSISLAISNINNKNRLLYTSRNRKCCAGAFWAPASSPTQW